MKRGLLLCLCLALLGGSLAAAEGAEILHGYAGDHVWQKVQLGAYPYEEDGTRRPVVWRVLTVKDGYALLLTDRVLDVQQAVQVDSVEKSKKRHFTRFKTYPESYLYQWMQEEMLPSLCREQDFSDALKETENGKLFPLTTQDYLNPEYGFPATKRGTHEKPVDKSAWVRECEGTPWAKTHQLYDDWKGVGTLVVDTRTGCSPYWTTTMRRDDGKGMYLQIVGYDGHLSWGLYPRVNIGVRPALWLDLSRCAVTGGSGSDEEPLILEVAKK